MFLIRGSCTRPATWGSGDSPVTEGLDQIDRFDLVRFDVQVKIRFDLVRFDDQVKIRFKNRIKTLTFI